MPEKSSRREQVESAARALFTTNGYDGTTINDIASTLGISKAAITYYFPAKSDFLTTLLGPLVDRLTDVVNTASADAWPTGARDLLRRYLTALLEAPDLALWADTDMALRMNDRPGTAIRRLDQRLAKHIAQPSTSRGDHMRALAVVGGIWRPLHHETAAEITHHLDEIVDAALVSYAPLN